MSQLDKEIIVNSVSSKINEAHVTGVLDLKVIQLYDILQEYEDFTQDEYIYSEVHSNILDTMRKMRVKYSSILCRRRIVAPKVTSYGSTGTPIVPINYNPIVKSFSLNIISDQTNFGVGNSYPAYTLKPIDFLPYYLDNNDGQFSYIAISTSSLDGMKLKYSLNATDGSIFGEKSGWTRIAKENIGMWTVFSNDDNKNTHQITYRVIDIVDGVEYTSNSSIITFIKSNDYVNLPATMGDNTIKVANGAVTTLTLEMFTSQLAPPYSDPEGDLIDAIRVIEISEANVGTFKLNSVAIQPYDVITREDMEAGLFTHEAAIGDDSSADSFTLEGRDEVNRSWVS